MGFLLLACLDDDQLSPLCGKFRHGLASLKEAIPVKERWIPVLTVLLLQLRNLHSSILVQHEETIVKLLKGTIVTHADKGNA